MENTRINYIKDTLDKTFPDAKCELNYQNNFELLIAVCLSAQTTDKRVNEISPRLFAKYPNSKSLMMANFEDVRDIIKPLGLANNKAKNIIALSKALEERYSGIVPDSFDELVTLPGCGRKTANVILSVGFNIPSFAVDTHVSRVSKVLGLSNSDDVIQIEEDLKRCFDKEDWSKMHHLLLLFGRYICKAKKPECDKCPLKDICNYKI